VSACRSCGAELTRTFLHSHIPPLRILVCEHCLLVQLPRFATPQPPSNWSDAETRLEHARKYTDRVVEELRLSPRHVVAQIASEGGYALDYFVAQGIPVLGIPVGGFTGSTAAAFRDEGVLADLLFANDVLAQVEDPNALLAGMKILLAARGVMTVEFPQLLRLVDGRDPFQKIQHGQICYFSLFTASRLFLQNGFTIYDVDELDTQGGSLRLFASHSEDPLRPITPRVDAFLDREHEAGLDSLEFYAQFAGET
jgi:hypothetical protein